jgi:hypothetical protein
MGGNSRAHIIDDIDGLDGLMKIISARNDDLVCRLQATTKEWPPGEQSRPPGRSGKTNNEMAAKKNPASKDV